MKSIISLLLYPAISFATFTIECHQIDHCLRVKEILMQEHQVPESLIVIKQRGSDCQQVGLGNVIAHLCINKKGELFLLSFKQDMIENSMDVFRIQEKN